MNFVLIIIFIFSLGLGYHLHILSLKNMEIASLSNQLIQTNTRVANLEASCEKLMAINENLNNLNLNVKSQILQAEAHIDKSIFSSHMDTLIFVGELFGAVLLGYSLFYAYSVLFSFSSSTEVGEAIIKQLPDHFENSQKEIVKSINTDTGTVLEAVQQTSQKLDIVLESQVKIIEDLTALNNIERSLSSIAKPSLPADTDKVIKSFKNIMQFI